MLPASITKSLDSKKKSASELFCRNLDGEVSVRRGPACRSSMLLRTDGVKSHGIQGTDVDEGKIGTAGLKESKDSSIKATLLLDGKASRVSTEVIQQFLLGTLIAPYLLDRETFNNFASTSQELWELSKHIPAPWPRRTMSFPGAVVHALAFSPDGRLLACAVDKTIHIWNQRTGHERILMNNSLVTSIFFSLDGKYLASAHRSQTSLAQGCILSEDEGRSAVQLFDTETWERIKTFQGDKFGGTFAVGISPDSRMVASGGADQVVRLYNVETGTCIDALHWHSSWVYSLDFSPDGNYIASVGEDESEVVLWNLKTGNVSVLTGHSETVHSVAFTPNGRYLVSGSDDETIRIWDFSSNFACTILEGNCSSVWAIACSPDSNTLISGGRDHGPSGRDVIHVWDISQQKCVGVLYGHSSLISSLSFSPNGRTIASGSFDSTMRTWNVATEHGLRRGDDKSPRSRLHKKSRIF